jgi:(p)ppGpp synthase/HD superfamily hydrolase
MAEHASTERAPIFDAIEFAARAHRMQLRKGTAIPYISHPLEVIRVLLQAGCTDTLAIAGVLHDTVEDAGVSFAEIRRLFGQDVAEIVQGVSEDKSQSWESRKAHTIESVKTAPMDVLLVTCADKLDNIRSIREDWAQVGDEIWARFRRPSEDQEKYYRDLADALLSRAQGEPSTTVFRRLNSEVSAFFREPGEGRRPKSVSGGANPGPVPSRR